MPIVIKTAYTSKDYFNFYKANYKNYINDYSMYMSILEDYYKEVLDAIIYKNLEFKMPFRLGSLRIKAKKSKVILDDNGNIRLNTAPPNWNKTLEHWNKIYEGLTKEEIKKIPNKKIIRHLNKHSSGKHMSWYWDKIISHLPHQNAYKLDINRNADRKLASAIKSGKFKYYE